ncbi:MAG: DUF86 domain-containing protein [Acidobacteriota bacterium]|jgi:uncharacterized protein YutE (UPF0331/DUF86 family)|nr:DUF86 domain-containing protein [Acidobacteriota bacterium]
MDEAILLAKLESLRRCLARITEKKPASAAALKSDFDLQDIISVNLERAVQLCVDTGLHVLSRRDRPLPDSMAGTFRELNAIGVLDSRIADRLAKAVGFRNMAVHAYQEINWDIVFSIITERLDDFRDFAAQICSEMK